jgi:multiple sugar transport system substrate-binding protein
VLAAGRHFHNPRQGRFGITWNGQRGMPLASTFTFLLACCGGSVLGLPREGMVWALEGISTDRVAVTLDTEAARASLDYMHGLVGISPPGVLDMDWNTALELFMSGKAAMTYCWSMRASRLQYDPVSKVKGRVRYLPQPAGPGGTNVTPLGGFLLAVPANLPEDRVPAAFEAIRWMTSPEAIRTHIKTGFPVLPRFSMGADPEIAASSPMVTVINDLGRHGLLQTWQRPPLPQYHQIEMVLGNEIHAALSRRKTDTAALADAQQRIERIVSHPPLGKSRYNQ